METTIEWTAIIKDGITYPGYTFNPWIGCQHVSPGCLNCYAETLNHRWNGDNWGLNKERRSTSPAYWKKPFQWNKKAGSMGVRLKVFCASLADVFEDREDLITLRHQLFFLIEQTPNLDWLLLTKRPENIVKHFTLAGYSMSLQIPKNIWLGCSIVNNTEIHSVFPKFQRAIEVLKPTISFVSAEPLLSSMPNIANMVNSINWLIVGAESGHHARPMDLSWVTDMYDDIIMDDKINFCKIFIKQLCVNGRKIPYESFPQSLQIRQFPYGR